VEFTCDGKMTAHRKRPARKNGNVPRGCAAFMG